MYVRHPQLCLYGYLIFRANPSGLSPAGIAVSISRHGNYCQSLVSVVCCQVEVCAPERNTKCGVSEYDREASLMRRTWPTRGCCTMVKLVFCATCFGPFVHHLLHQITKARSGTWIATALQWKNKVLFLTVDLSLVREMYHWKLPLKGSI